MNIGFIGLGVMGKPMARNLIRAGYQLKVYDVNTTAMEALTTDGALAAGSCAEVAAGCELVITMLPNSPHVGNIVSFLFKCDETLVWKTGQHGIFSFP